MKKIKCYGRAKSKAINTSIEKAVFDDLGVQPPVAAASSKIKRSSNPESSDIVLFTSIAEVKPTQKKILRKRMSKICKSKHKRVHPSVNNSKLSPSKVSEVKKQYHLRTRRQKSTTKPRKSIQQTSKLAAIKERYNLRTRRQKPISKRKKPIQQFNESNLSSSSKVLKFKKYNMRYLRPKYRRKKKCVNEINVFSKEKEPRWSSINEYPLTVQKRGDSFKGILTAFGKEYNFDKEVRVTLDKDLQVNLTKLDQEVRVNLTRLNLDDFSFIPVAVNSLENKMISSAVTSVQKCNIGREMSSFTPIKIHQSYSNDDILTSTPLTLQKTHKKVTFPNISGIYTLSNKDNCSADRPFFSKPKSHSTFTVAPVKPKSHSTFIVTPVNRAVFPEIEMPALPPVELQLFTKNRVNTSVTHLSTFVHSSRQQMSRSCEVRSEVDKSVLSFKSSIRSFCSENEINATSFIQDKTIGCTLSTLLQISQQDSVITFQDIYDWRETAVRKIGEGTYGEVFMITKRKQSSVIKVIPFKDNNEDPNMQSIESVLSEIKVSLCLSELRTDENNQTKNFNKLNSIKIVKGCYPMKMFAAWDSFMDTKTCYNCRPDFGDQQMFAVLELEYGGKDMGAFVMRNAVEAESIFKQIVISLAIAEEKNLFEHRDLHLGNILVKRNNSKRISYILRGKPFVIPNEGLVVSIIDFTLSRVLDSGCVFYNDLADDEVLFNQTGDYQFKVYKLTRQGLNNQWQKSHLFSNVLWLSYLCVKFLEYEYSRKPSKKHLKSIECIKKIQKKLQDCKSAMDVLQNINILDFVPESSQKSSQQCKTIKYFDRKSNSCVKV